MIADIRIKTSLLGHRKLRRMERELGRDCFGYLVKLWLRTAMTRPDGSLRGMDAVDIACEAEWPGDPGAFVDALELCGWLDRDADGNMRLHDWNEHQAWVVGHDARSAQARKAAQVRHHGRAEGAKKDAKDGDGCAPVFRKMPEVGPKNGQNMPAACGEHAHSMRGACGEHADSKMSNALLPSSSSTLQEDIKAPPERAKALSTPHGGERQPVKRFVPPSVEEIAAYCRERGNGIDAQAVHDHYTANGWKVGKNPMKDWRAAVRTWEAKRRQEQRAQAAPQSPAARLLAKSTGGAQL